MKGAGTGGAVGRRDLLRAAWAGAALAAAPGPVRAATRYRALEELLDSYVGQERVPGAIVAIVRPGRFRPDYVAVGRSDFGGGRAVDHRTLFRIFSMTKPVTGIAMMQQVGEGRITVDTPLADVLPQFANMQVLSDAEASLEAAPARAPIRMRHLLTHTAGFSYHIMGNRPIEREYRRLGLLPGGGTGRLGRRPGDADVPSLDAFLDRLATLPLVHEPGTAYRYSVSLDVAGGVLERLAGTRLDRVFETQLFAPLGMRDTAFHVPENRRARLAAAWAFMDPRTMEPSDTPNRFDGPEATDWADPPPLLAGGAGLVSSAEDYARFAQMLLNEGMFEGRRLLPAGAARLGMGNLLEPGVFFHGAKDRTPEGYGAGGSVSLFDTRRDAPFGMPAGVYGWGGAAGTLFHVDPVRRVAVVLMLQYMPSNRFPMVRDLATALNREAAAASL